MVNLEIDLLRFFVRVVELDSFALAGHELGRTPSAVSLKIKRLETLAGHTLLQRSAQGHRLTERGRQVLDHARRVLRLNDALASSLRSSHQRATVVRVGIDDFAVGARLLRLAALARDAFGPAGIEVVNAPTDQLAARWHDGQLDVLLAGAEPGTASAGLGVGRVELAWAAAAGWRADADGVLPVVMPLSGYALRQAALGALQAWGRPWRLCMTASNSHALASGIGAGIGVGALARDALAAQAGRLVNAAVDGPAGAAALPALPALPALEVRLFAKRVVDAGAVAGFVERLRQALKA